MNKSSKQSLNALSTRHLLVQIKQWKHQNNVRNLFKASNKDMRMMSKLLKVIKEDNIIVYYSLIR